MSVLAVDFLKRKVTDIVTNKKDLFTCRRNNNRRVAVYINDAKDKLSAKQYVMFLEGIVSKEHCNKINSVMLIGMCEEFSRLI